MQWYQDLTLTVILLELYDGPGSMEEWIASELSAPVDVFEEKHGDRHMGVRAFLEDALEMIRA